jgi:hypothetical protein
MVPGLALTTECRPNRIVLHWTVPQWIQQGVSLSDFRIYRCAISSGTCTPIAPAYQTINDPMARMYVDTGVSQNTVYCYKVTFRAQPTQVPPTFFESPFSNTECNQMCSTPDGGPTDVAFIVDNTPSMGDSALTELKQNIETVLDDIEAYSGGNYQLALLTPEMDRVNVRLAFSLNNRGLFAAALGSTEVAESNLAPESTDECLNTAVHALAAAGRQDPEQCLDPPNPLQYGNFASFRPSARKLVVLITDAPPGGFCDDFDPVVDSPRAHAYAQDAYGNQNGCIRLNAIQVALGGEILDSYAEPVMLDYAQTTCGWYSVVAHNGTGLIEAILKMLYQAGACSCP